jgi:hypothetical protein
MVDAFGGRRLVGNNSKRVPLPYIKNIPKCEDVCVFVFFLYYLCGILTTCVRIYQQTQLEHNTNKSYAMVFHIYHGHKNAT